MFLLSIMFTIKITNTDVTYDIIFIAFAKLVFTVQRCYSLDSGESVGNTTEKNSSLLFNPNAPVAVSMDMLAVKHCFNKIFQFLTVCAS